MDTPPKPFEPLAPLAANNDNTERAKQLGHALEAVPRLQAWLRAERQRAVQAMRADGMSHADVAKALGVTRARAQQIAEGRTSGGKTAASTAPQ